MPEIPILACLLLATMRTEQKPSPFTQTAPKYQLLIRHNNHQFALPFPAPQKRADFLLNTQPPTGCILFMGFILVVVVQLLSYI